MNNALKSPETKPSGNPFPLEFQWLVVGSNVPGMCLRFGADVFGKILIAGSLRSPVSGQDFDPE